MIGIGVGIGFSRRAAGAAPAFDAAAQVVIDAMSPEPDAARKTAINDFVVALKDGGAWAQLDFLHVYAAHSEQAALINWKAPGTHNATAVNAPTFTVDRGFAGNGTTSYLNTNFVPSTDGVNYTLNDASLGVYSRTDSGENATDIGGRNGTTSRVVNFNLRRSTGTVILSINQDSLSSGPNTDNSTGLFVLRRSASSAVNALRNGVEYHSHTGESSNRPEYSLFVGGINTAGTPGNFSERQYALAFAAAAMSEAEQLALFNAVQDYMTAVGAEV